VKDGNGVDHTEDLHDPLHPVEVAQLCPQGHDVGKGGEAGGFVARLEVKVLTEAAADPGAVGAPGAGPGQERGSPVRTTGDVRAHRCGRRRELQLQLFQAGFGVDARHSGSFLGFLGKRASAVAAEGDRAPDCLDDSKGPNA